MSERAVRFADAPLPEGTIIGGRFRLVRVRGQGGMGAVYEAEDPVIGRRVAVKLLHLTNRVAIERFEREARAASRISSRHIAAVHDFGKDEAHGHFIIMELLEGETLDRVIATRAPLPPSQAAAIGAEIAEALHAAHRAQVVHRDLKPSNVLVLAEGGLKVLDFGIARMLAPDRAEPNTTSPDTIVGTPRYISPEAVTGSDVGPAADLYSLGVVLFELLTGRAPFVDDVPAVLLTKHLQHPPPRIEDVSPTITLPDGLSDLVARLLAKDPADRPSSARRVADALRAMTDEEGPVRLQSGIHATPTSNVRRRRAVWPWIAGTVLLVLAAIALGAGLALHEEAPRTVVARPLPSDPAPLLPPPMPEPAPPSTVEIAITTDPRAAEIYLDGVLSRSPIQLPLDGREHELRVQAAGYATETRDFRADRDQSMEIVLRRTPRDRGLPVKLRGW